MRALLAEAHATTHIDGTELTPAQAERLFVPRQHRLRLADQLNRDLATLPPDEPVQPGRALEARGRLLVYTGSIDDSAFDHRADREARIGASREQPNARRL